MSQLVCIYNGMYKSQDHSLPLLSLTSILLSSPPSFPPPPSFFPSLPPSFPPSLSLPPSLPPSLLLSLHPSFFPSIPPSFPPSLLLSLHPSFFPSIPPSFPLPPLHHPLPPSFPPSFPPSPFFPSLLLSFPPSSFPSLPPQTGAYHDPDLRRRQFQRLPVPRVRQPYPGPRRGGRVRACDHPAETPRPFLQILFFLHLQHPQQLVPVRGTQICQFSDASLGQGF